MPNSSKQPLIWEKFNLTAKVAVVTGGAGLLGAEFCRTLAEAGASVVIADLNKSSAQDLGEELINHGSAALAVETDVGDLTSVQKMVEAALDTFGRLDILINSAALDPKFEPEHIVTTTERSPNAELQTTLETKTTEVVFHVEISQGPFDSPLVVVEVRQLPDTRTPALRISVEATGSGGRRLRPLVELVQIGRTNGEPVAEGGIDDRDRKGHEIAEPDTALCCNVHGIGGRFYVLRRLLG